eukprot:1494767-Prymnesium_polylepis.1
MATEIESNNVFATSVRAYVSVIVPRAASGVGLAEWVCSVPMPEPRDSIPLRACRAFAQLRLPASPRNVIPRVGLE